MYLNNLKKKVESDKNNLEKLSTSNLWVMCSDGIMSDLETLLDNMVLNGEDSAKIKVINRYNGCSELIVDRQWLIEQLED